MSVIHKIQLQSVIPKSVLSKLVNPEIVNYFHNNFETELTATPLALTKIPNSIITVTGDVSNVSTTYLKIFNYLNNGQFIDPSYKPLKKYYVRGLDKIFKPMFLVPVDFKLNFANLRDNKSILQFKSHYENASIMKLDNLSHELWRFNNADLPKFLSYSLLDTIETRKYFVTPQQNGLSTITDEELVTKKISISKKNLDKLQSQVVRFTNLQNNYLCDIQIDQQMYDDASSENEINELVNITGPENMVNILENLFSYIKRDYDRE